MRSLNLNRKVSNFNQVYNDFRSCFFWTHRSLGCLTFILGMVSIILSVKLSKLRLDDSYYTILSIYIIATIFVYIILKWLYMLRENSAMIAELETAEKVENLRMRSKNFVGLFYLGFCLCFSLAYTVGIFSV